MTTFTPETRTRLEADVKMFDPDEHWDRDLRITIIADLRDTLAYIDKLEGALRGAQNLIHLARAAANKLNAAMLRSETEPRHEFEALVEVREEISNWRATARSILGGEGEG